MASLQEQQGSEPMDIDVDPVDGGPKASRTGTGIDPMASQQEQQQQPQHLSVVTASPASATASQSSSSSTTTSKEEEARQAIDMLHGDDVGNRVAAAHRLESVAAALGPERTREVCICLIMRIICNVTPSSSSSNSN
jgi:hypothetical protein